MKKNSIQPSIDAADELIKTRKKSLTAKQINDALKAANLQPLSGSDLARNFLRKQDDRRGTVYSRKPAEKKGAKKPESQKKQKCAKQTPCGGCKQKTGSCKISVEGNFDVRMHNQMAALHNCLFSLPEAARKPEKYLFCVGEGDWPENYRGIGIVKDEACSGVLLAPREMIMLAGFR